MIAKKKTINVLFVCLGNICRSPAAEGIFLNLLEAKGESAYYCVESAGTSAHHQGELPDRRMRLAAKGRGIELNSRSRPVDPSWDFDHFDYILAMDDQNLKNLKELSAHLERPKGQVRLMMDFARSFSEVTEVPDPYWGGDRGFEQVLDYLEDACLGLFDYTQEQFKQQI